MNSVAFVMLHNRQRADIKQNNWNIAIEGQVMSQSDIKDDYWEEAFISQVCT